jgi:hypothetical protein
LVSEKAAAASGIPGAPAMAYADLVVSGGIVITGNTGSGDDVRATPRDDGGRVKEPA